MPEYPKLEDDLDLIGLGAKLEALSDVQAIWAQLLDGLRDYRVDFAIYLTVTEDRKSPSLLTNIPEIYEGMDPADDPFLEWCCNSYEPTRTGGGFLSEHDYLPNSAKKFIARASMSGFKTGFGIPMRLNGSTRFGGFNLGTRLTATEFDQLIWPKRAEFRGLCLLVHRRIEELQSKTHTKTKQDFRKLLIAPENANVGALSPREKEIIYLISQGLSRKECARVCGISPNTVHEYTKAAYRKLGVSNRIHAAQIVLADTPQS